LQATIKNKNFKIKTQKMSLANIQGKLSRAEMKTIMAGSGDICGYQGASCWYPGDGQGGCCPGWYCLFSGPFPATCQHP